MNFYRFLTVVTAAVALSGCASSNTPVPTHEPYVKPSLIMLTADQAARRGIQVNSPTAAEPSLPAGIEALDARAVTTSSGVKVYTINRAVDPADGDLMHEEHAVYRRETSPRWRLDAPADQKILVGPEVTDGRQEIQPLLSKELTTFLADERRATESNQKAINALFQAVDALTRQQQALLRRAASKTTKADTSAEKPSETEPATATAGQDASVPKNQNAQ